ncbi:MAG: FAD-dependent oxidoreductase [Clostridia bacterium]
MKRRIFSLMLILALLIPAAAFADGYTAGTYTGTANGMKGPVTAEVTVSADAITDIKLIDLKETYGIGRGLMETPDVVIPAQILDGQTLSIDMVSGATITCAAILGAVTDALTQAGADVEALKAKTVEPDPIQDTEATVDVVIAGAGAAGLAAGIEARRAGANVLILEKQEITGGATARSGGKILAIGSEWQKAQGFEDTPEAAFEYLKGVGGDALDDDKVKAFVDHSVDTLNWITDMGVQMKDVEAIHASLTPWRVHNALGAGGMTDGHGGQFTVPMTKTYNDAGGKILYGATADGLITDEAGKVIGMTATMQDGSKLTVHANSAILATGGYAQNRDYYKNQPAVEGYVTSVPVGNVGDGLVMAEKVGARVTIPDYAMVVYVSFTSGVGINEEAGLIVNKAGARVANEYTYQYHVGDQLQKTGSNLGYYICDANDLSGTVQYALTQDSTPKADSIEELAKLIEVDPAALSATVNRYNELCDKGVDDDFGKPAEKLIKLTGPTYAAIKMQPSVTVSYGGLTTDMDSHVLDTKDQPIPGLYAAGEVAFEGLFGTEYPCCGMAIGSAIYYGRIAGANAVTGK